MALAAKLFKESVDVASTDVSALCPGGRRRWGQTVVMELTERIPNSMGTLPNTQLFID